MGGVPGSPLSRDPARPRLSFARRVHGALEPAAPKQPGFAVPVRDLAFVAASGRIAALRVAAPGTPAGEGVIAAVFTTPLRDGRVRVPGGRARGWLRPEAQHAGLRWASGCLGAEVLDCAGARIGAVCTLVVEHLQQRVVAFLLDGGGRVELADVAFLPDGRLLVDEEQVVDAPMATWLAWQDDLEGGRMWWEGQLQVPPPLEPVAAAAR